MPTETGIGDGNVACRALFGRQTDVNTIRGKWREVAVDESLIQAMPTFHPIDLLRKPEDKRLSFRDLKALRAALDQQMDDRLAPFRPGCRLSNPKHPPAERSGGRLLAVGSNGLAEWRVRDLPLLLRPGDLLVFNDTRVLHARLAAIRSSGGRVELLVMPDPDEVGRFWAMAKPARRLRVGERLDILDGFGPSPSKVLGCSAILGERRSDGCFAIALEPNPETVMSRAGMVPIPPYLGRETVAEDAERYQTVFGQEWGAVAAPTAGLHFGEALLRELRNVGCRMAWVTLHVGAGTFRSLRSEDLDRKRLHKERYFVPKATVDAVAETRSGGGRVIAVGTTSTRTLESACDENGVLVEGWGTTELFIQPGDTFRVVNGLWTNFHLPESSLLMLVCAFGGKQRIMHAYQHAVAEKYRFFSYGDAMLVWPKGDELAE